MPFQTTRPKDQSRSLDRSPSRPNLTAQHVCRQLHEQTRRYFHFVLSFSDVIVIEMWCWYWCWELSISNVTTPVFYLRSWAWKISGELTSKYTWNSIAKISWRQVMCVSRMKSTDNSWQGSYRFKYWYYPALGPAWLPDAKNERASLSICSQILAQCKCWSRNVCWGGWA